MSVHGAISTVEDHADDGFRNENTENAGEDMVLDGHDEDAVVVEEKEAEFVAPRAGSAVHITQTPCGLIKADLTSFSAVKHPEERKRLDIKYEKPARNATSPRKPDRRR